MTNKSLVLKNYLGFNASFAFLFAAINVASSIEPIVNQEQNLAGVSQIVNSSVQILSILVLPQVIIEVLGFKYAFILGEIFNTSYVAIQIYVRWYTLVPSKLNYLTAILI